MEFECVFSGSVEGHSFIDVFEKEEDGQVYEEEGEGCAFLVSSVNGKWQAQLHGHVVRACNRESLPAALKTYVERYYKVYGRVPSDWQPDEYWPEPYMSEV